MIRETARLKNFLMALLIGSVLLAGTMSAFAETGTDYAGAVLPVNLAVLWWSGP